MDSYDVKRLIQCEAIKAEIEGMKAANSDCRTPHESNAYGEHMFSEKAEELRSLAAMHNDQL